MRPGFFGNQSFGETENISEVGRVQKISVLVSSLIIVWEKTKNSKGTQIKKNENYKKREVYGTREREKCKKKEKERKRGKGNRKRNN